MVLRRFSTFLNLTAAVAALCLTHFPVNAQPVDQVRIVVNGRPITAIDLARRESFLRSQLAERQQVAPPTAELKDQVQQRAIAESIMLGMARKQGLYPNDAAVSAVLENNALQANTSVAAMLAGYAKIGVSESEHRGDVADQMALSRLRDRQLAALPRVTDSEIERFLGDPSSGIKQEFQLYILAIAKPNNAAGSALDAASDEAKSLRARAVNAVGAAFLALQTQVKQAPDKHVVDLGYKSSEQLPSRFATVAESLSQGQTSDVIETSGGFYIIRLNDRKLVVPTVMQTRARHILFPTFDDGGVDKAQQESVRVHNLLVLDASRFEALAREYSADGSAAKGGDLGWVLPGDTVPEFERMMDLLGPAEISKPTKSPFGWHIIRVDERVTKEIPRDRLLAQAKQMLAQRKGDAALATWLEKIKAEAYIEYR